MATQRVRMKPRKPLTAEQKVAFGLLMFLGFGGVVFGAQSFGANLARPIQEQIAQYYTGKTYLTDDERAAKELEESKNKDTDGDGLVDYDELYIYKTSPYIADSDSDGYSDKEEVYSGNNPNCPTGKDCGFTVGGTNEEAANTSSADAFLNGLGAEQLKKAGEIDFKSEDDVAAFFKQATIEQIRSALIASGMSEEDLSKIDDKTLEEFFNGALDEAAANGALSEFVTR